MKKVLHKLNNYETKIIYKWNFTKYNHIPFNIIDCNLLILSIIINYLYQKSINSDDILIWIKFDYEKQRKRKVMSIVLYFLSFM